MTVAAPDPDPELESIVTPHPRRDPDFSDDPTHVRNGGSTLRDWLRPWVYWPDPDIIWSRQVVRNVLQQDCCPDWVLTTSPPESVHWAGAALKQRLGCRWAGDFRDHWFERAFQTYRRGSTLRARLERYYAKHLLKTLDHISAVNSAILEEAVNLSGERARRHALLLEHFTIPRSESAHVFEGGGPHLVHTGSFEMSDPDTAIEDLLVPFARACQQRPGLRLHLVGRLSPREIAQVKASPVADSISIYGVVPIQTALSMQQGADALVLVASAIAPVPPGKIVEFLDADKPIIALGQVEWISAYRLPLGDPEMLMIGADALPLPVRKSKPPSAHKTAQELLESLRNVED